MRAAALSILMMLIPVPFLFTAGSVLRGKLIHRRQTRLVQRAQVIDLAVMGGVIAVGVLWLVPVLHLGASALGALAMLAVYATDLLILGLGVRANPRPGDSR